MMLLYLNYFIITYYTYIQFYFADEVKDPCKPSPCGPYSTCDARHDQAICSCLPQYFGNAPHCRPECITSSECPLDKACVKQRCIDPCINACGANAECRVHHHSPYCECLRGYQGDPFVLCSLEPPVLQIGSPCETNPCGQYATCKNVEGTAVCSCKQGYRGVPPYCAPECTINEDCSYDKACVREHCEDPCIGSCGVNTNCKAANHLAICTCILGHVGNPFTGCYILSDGNIFNIPLIYKDYVNYCI